MTNINDELIAVVHPDMLEFLAPEARPDTEEYKSYYAYQQARMAERIVETGKPQLASKEISGFTTNYKRPSHKEKVQLARARVVAKMRIDTENVLAEFARVAFFDIRNLFDDEGNPLPLGQLDDDTAAAISGIDVQKLGKSEGFATVVKYKIADKLKALEALAKRLNLFEEHNTLKGDIGISKMSKTERARRVAFMLAEAIRKKEQ